MISSQDLRIRILCQVVEKKITKLSESLDQQLEGGENLLSGISATLVFSYTSYEIVRR